MTEKPIQIVITKTNDKDWKVAVMGPKTTLNTFSLKEDFVFGTVRRIMKDMEVPNG